MKEELVVLNNLKSSNVIIIREGLAKEQRLARLTIQAKEELEPFTKIAHKISNRTRVPLFYQPKRLQETKVADSILSDLPKNADLTEISEEQIKKTALSPKLKK